MYLVWKCKYCAENCAVFAQGAFEQGFSCSLHNRSKPVSRTIDSKYFGSATLGGLILAKKHCQGVTFLAELGM